VLERRDRLGGGWLDRWDSLCLVAPNFTILLPGKGALVENARLDEVRNVTQLSGPRLGRTGSVDI
jgi:cation diffusion facilitator CzcD-associated flavoprotein CzcO